MHPSIAKTDFESLILPEIINIVGRAINARVQRRIIILRDNTAHLNTSFIKLVSFLLIVFNFN